MKGGLSSKQTRALKVAFLGALIVTFGMVTSPVITSLSLTQGVGGESLASGYAYFALTLIVFGLCILYYGVTTILTNWSTGETSENPPSKSSIIAKIFATKRYARLLLLSALVYSIFYAFASGIIVFQPASNFSEVYHVGIPSFAIATCCGPIGETPEIVVYVTHHLGLLLIPINLLLLFSISWLVGLNASFAAFTLSFRTRNIGLSWSGGVGAFIGLFTSCPTCAGLAIIALLGGTGTLSAAFFLGPLQTLFVGLSIPILVATPILLARSLHNFEGRGACPRP